MQKQCAQCQISFEITQEDLNFYDKVSPTFGWKKFTISTPTLCPDCRQQRRLAFRNERKLYKRKCNATWEQIVSIYSQNKPYKVYNQKEWWSDKWDALSYWKGFDFGRGFFEQFEELLKDVPVLCMLNNHSENSEYCNQTTWMKNSYLCCNAIWSEDCYYSKGLLKCINSVDCLRIYNCEHCYECINCHQCFNCNNLQNCHECSKCSFCFDCNNCNNCFWCTNLRNKEYYIYNKKYDKESYIIEINKINKEYSISQIKQKFIEMSSKWVHKNLEIENSENCLWDCIYDSKNSNNSFDIVWCENLKFWYDLRAANSNSYDISFVGDNIHYSYETMTTWINATKCLFTNDCYEWINNILYSDSCMHNDSNLFGCIWLRNKSYCILNKQYTREEYELLVPRIIEHMIKTWEWWEFFPVTISHFAYNETVAQEYFPLNKEEVLKRGWKWKDEDNTMPIVDKLIPAQKLPEDISKIPDDILNWAIKCEATWRPFRIISQELAFYRKHNLPIPHFHPDERHRRRMLLRNLRKLFDRKCTKCWVDIKTTYASDRPEIVYCEKCYEKEVY